MTLAIAEACDLCGGEGTLPILFRRAADEPRTEKVMPCPRCRCPICGGATDSPGPCGPCESRLDAEFERRQDMAEPGVEEWWAA